MTLPDDLHQILKNFPKPLVVGGSVRDFLLGETPKDFDIEVQEIPQDQLAECLKTHGTLETVGESFGVFKLTTPKGNTYDFSIPRLDNKIGKGHKDFSTNKNPSLPFSVSASRRDLTINAIAWNPHTQELLDPFCGQRDLQTKTLRHINHQFGEDPLRPLRLLQFSARLGFTIHPETVILCRNLLKIATPLLAKERIQEEFLKFLLKGKHHCLALKEFEKTGWLNLFPELQALKNLPQDPLHHPEGDVLTHTGLCLESLQKLPNYQALSSENKKILGLATLCHDLGKALTTKKEYNSKLQRDTITSHNHQIEGLHPTNTLLQKLNQNTKTIQTVQLLVEHHMDHIWSKSLPHEVAKLAAQLSPQNPHTPNPTLSQNLHHLSILVEADHRGRHPKPGKMPEKMEEILKMAKTLGCLHKPLPNPVQGEDLLNLGFPEGPTLAHLLQACYTETLENPHITKADLIKSLQNPEKLLKKTGKCPKCLLTGTELMALGVPQGPSLGQITQKLLRRQIRGELHTKIEAQSFVQKSHPNLQRPLSP